MNKESVSHTHTHTHRGILLSHKKHKVLPFAGLWTDSEGIMIVEISQTNTNFCRILFTCGIKKIHQASEYNKKRSKITDKENTLLIVVASGRWRGHI